MAKVLYNKRVLAFPYTEDFGAGGYYKLGIRWEDLPPIEPGQFIMLRIAKQIDPLLRRPFGVYKILGHGACPHTKNFGMGACLPVRGRTQTGGKGPGIEILYRVVGRGTRLMTDLKPGDSVDVLGPLGNSFPLEIRSQEVIMVAGGIGIVPFYMLAGKLKKARLLFGGRSKDDLPALEDFKKLKIDMEVSTDDGSVGEKGLVTGLLLKRLSKNSVVYACGSKGMLKEVARIAEGADIPCYVSLDNAMACGIGACLGCAVKVKGQGARGKGQEKQTSELIYKMVCKDGPVFDAREIEWEEI
ncbi:MAG: dihydroorotate dehydrogenase electron transfer subunit [Deltaproteobacteria bacterium]|nr:dihydroorotate dehydrogenase electron transfer subunit [Deltaproteobacteria bacterium]